MPVVAESRSTPDQSGQVGWEPIQMLTKVGRANSKAFEGDQPSGLKRCHSISNRPEVSGQVHDYRDWL